MDSYTYLGNADTVSIEEMYKQYQKNPKALDEGWRKFFEGFDFARIKYVDDSALPGEVPDSIRKEFNVINLINQYRSSGHLFTKTNPVRERRKYTPSIDEIELLGLSENDMDTVFRAGDLIGIGPSRLRDIIAHLKQTYCNSIGVEYKYIRDAKIVSWLEKKMESRKNTPVFSIEIKKRILEKLNEAVVFENFLATRFVGQKRFSLEGAETLIPALDAIIESGSELGIEEFVLGMAHRGRLNVLANIMNKTYSEIFSEFEGIEYEDALFSGDVKYHLGYSSDVINSKGKKIHLSLCPNPSHLEAVDPVVEGITRAKLDNRYNNDLNKIAPILIHGDAAFAAQGVVYEVIQMSQLEANKTGGTIHVVVNNQVGFTTNYLDARSSTYCTDVAKVVLSPVFHVNADDVEAVVYVIHLAMEFRQEFHKDIFIDLLGYRKYGHNEGDEPRFTQPMLYKIIAKHPNPRELYNEKLLAQGEVEAGLAREMEQVFKSMLQERFEESKQTRKAKPGSHLMGEWKGLRIAHESDFLHSPETGIKESDLKRIADKILHLPEGKKFFNKTEKIFSDRRKLVIEEGKSDWAMAELFAYASLLEEGHRVRVSGQDVERGTFAHRHAVLKLEDSEVEYIPLNHISENQQKFEIYNSLLSEYAALGFDFGYAMSAPNSLVVWEAQFGDFANGAQIIIDQYLSTSEDKWRRMNGIVLLLPHGYEHQGAEHSSARIERFLTLCAENNMQVANCTTPANFFHLLRRQLHRKFRKPLIVFTPKSLLRHPKCISKLDEFSHSKFYEIIEDTVESVSKIEKVIFCSGKIYYDIIDKKMELNEDTIQIIRIEQLYPFPANQIEVLVKKYEHVKMWIWAQEEPENMGAWTFMLRKLSPLLSCKLHLISRAENASPATGSSKQSMKEQKEIIDAIFNKIN